jgi:PadR family transcriptional regulator PadR
MNLKQTEQVVMLAMLRKQPDAYGVSIYEELVKRRCRGRFRGHQL